MPSSDFVTGIESNETDLASFAKMTLEINSPCPKTIRQLNGAHRFEHITTKSERCHFSVNIWAIFPWNVRCNPCRHYFMCRATSTGNSTVEPIDWIRPMSAVNSVPWCQCVCQSFPNQMIQMNLNQPSLSHIYWLSATGSVSEDWYVDELHHSVLRCPCFSVSCTILNLWLQFPLHWHEDTLLYAVPRIPVVRLIGICYKYRLWMLYGIWMFLFQRIRKRRTFFFLHETDSSAVMA